MDLESSCIAPYVQTRAYDDAHAIQMHAGYPAQTPKSCKILSGSNTIEALARTKDA